MLNELKVRRYCCRWHRAVYRCIDLWQELDVWALDYRTATQALWPPGLSYLYMQHVCGARGWITELSFPRCRDLLWIISIHTIAYNNIASCYCQTETPVHNSSRCLFSFIAKNSPIPAVTYHHINMSFISSAIACKSQKPPRREFLFLQMIYRDLSATRRAKHSCAHNGRLTAELLA